MKKLNEVLDDIVTPKGQGNMAGELSDKIKNVESYKNATKPAPVASPVRAAASPADRIKPEAKYGDRGPEKRIDTSDMTKPLGSFEKGTDNVPKTGVYKLHKGEAVIPKEKNMNKSAMDAVEKHLSGGEKKPAKEIKEMVHTKSANGKHIVTHRHHRPEHHPDETHVLNDMAELHSHMEDHAGTPNDGEAAPAAGGPPQMTAAPSPAPMQEPV